MVFFGSQGIALAQDNVESTEVAPNAETPQLDSKVKDKTDKDKTAKDKTDKDKTPQTTQPPVELPAKKTPTETALKPAVPEPVTADDSASKSSGEETPENAEPKEIKIKMAPVKIREDASNNSRPLAEDLIGEDVEQAKALIAEARFDEASEFIEKALTKTPNAALALMAAAARFKAGHFANARIHLELWGKMEGIEIPAPPPKAIAPQDGPLDQSEGVPNVSSETGMSIDESSSDETTSEEMVTDEEEGEALSFEVEDLSDDAGPPNSDFDRQSDGRDDLEDPEFAMPVLPPEIASNPRAAAAFRMVYTIDKNTVPVSIVIPEDARRPRAGKLWVSATRTTQIGTLPELSWSVANDWSPETIAARLEPGTWLVQLEAPGYRPLAVVMDPSERDLLEFKPVLSFDAMQKNMPVDERLAYQEAIELFREGRYAEASDAIDALLENGPQSQEALWVYARSLHLSNQPARAYRSYEKLLALFPGESLTDRDRVKVAWTSLEELAKKQRGVVRINSDPPGAQVTVDGKEQLGGATPFSIQLMPGRYSLTARAEGFPDYVQKIAVSGDEPTIVMLRLKAPKLVEKNRLFHWGVRAGIGAPSLFGPRFETVRLDGGFEAGGSIITEYRGLTSVFIRLEAGLNQQTYDFFQSESEINGQWRFMALEIPVLARVPLYRGFDLGAGPGIAFLLNAEEEVSEVTDLQDDFKAAYFKGHVFVGYSQVLEPWFLRAEVRYTRTLTPMAEDVSGDVSVQSQSILLNLEVRR